MVTSTATRPRLALQILWRVALFVLAFALISALFIVPLVSVLSGWADAFPVRAQLYADTAGAVAMLAATWVMTRFVDRRPFRTIGLAPKNAPRDMAAGLAV